VQRSIIVPKGDADAQYVKVDAKIERLFGASATTILSEFDCSVDADEDSNSEACGT